MWFISKDIKQLNRYLNLSQDLIFKHADLIIPVYLVIASTNFCALLTVPNYEWRIVWRIKSGGSKQSVTTVHLHQENNSDAKYVPQQPEPRAVPFVPRICRPICFPGTQKISVSREMLMLWQPISAISLLAKYLLNFFFRENKFAENVYGISFPPSYAL